MAPWVVALLGRWSQFHPNVEGIALACLGAAAAAAWIRGGRRVASVRALFAVGLVGAVVTGLVRAWQRRACYDDAFITFRFARNWAEGHGPVWNLGERVEGYTNFLWTALLAAGIRWTPIEAPLLALAATSLSFVACLALAARLGVSLAGAAGLLVPVPLAAILLAGQRVFTDFATTGMETMLGALLVLGMAGCVARQAGDRDRAIASALGALAVLNRLDHALFWAAGGAVVVGEALRQPRVALRRAAIWVAPAVALLGPWLLWKQSFYGDLLPNTWYAKAEAGAWWSQGFKYLLLFLLGEQAWLPLLVALLALVAALPDAPSRRFAAFVALGGGTFGTYVVRVGGDFMWGRFFVSVVPLVAVLAERVTWQLLAGGRARRVAGCLAAAALLASLSAPRIVEPRELLLGVLYESDAYPVRRLRPFDVRHVHDLMGKRFGSLHARGVQPVLASGGIGMLGYYSRLTIIDALGLTDPVVAREPVRVRTRPGHEKRARREYLLERGVHFLRLRSGQAGFHPERFRDVTALRFEDPPSGDPWAIAHWDTAVMRAVAEADPGIKFTDFPKWLDRYMRKEGRRNPRRVREDLPWFQEYYFDHNADPKRLKRLRHLARLPPV